MICLSSVEEPKDLKTTYSIILDALILDDTKIK